MRTVNNLDHINQCPNCSGFSLISTRNEFGRPFKQCCVCTEEIFEDEDTQYEPIEVGKAPDDIDDSLMEIEYAISDLTRYATTQHELEQTERIRDIFDELISVIRRMKQ